MTADPQFNDPLRHLHDAAYTWGDCAALLYDRQRPDLFPGPSYLTTLYERCRQSGNRTHDSKFGILPDLFCGMRDLSCEAVVSYLSQLPVIVVGEWRRRLVETCSVCRQPLQHVADGEWFHADVALSLSHEEVRVLLPDLEQPPNFCALGFCFPTNAPLLARADLQLSNRNAIFAGYCFFEEAWRTPQQQVLMWLGLSYLMYEFRLAAVHGVRYADNWLTARFAGRFGFRDLGTIPNYLYRVETGDLAAATVSSLSRVEFEARLRAVLASLREGEEWQLHT